ncbi:MAG: hypothetical protein MI921_10855, partial [Cytophagales bacterium]|nr:hypothetical protein [Cytophagales bacterium]
TISVDAGTPHLVKDVSVRWPLRIRGSGPSPEDTVLVCPKGADAAIDFRSAATAFPAGQTASNTVALTVWACETSRPVRAAVIAM